MPFKIVDIEIEYFVKEYLLLASKVMATSQQFHLNATFAFMQQLYSGLRPHRCRAMKTKSWRKITRGFIPRKIHGTYIQAGGH